MARKEIEVDGKKFSLAYEKEGRGPQLLILHGWGSNKEIMRQAFGGKGEFEKIYLDLPGFGKSSNDYILTTHDYAKIVRSFLQAIDASPDIIFGHSFGGKVATLLDPKLLVLLSSAGIVEPKPLKVRAKITLFKLFKPFGGAKIRNLFVSNDAKNMPQNMYETFKNVVDEDFRSQFAAHKKRALIFWGKEDKATSLQSGEMIASLIENAKFYSLDGDHYFFLHYGDFIMKKVEEEYEKLSL
ncbi:alpha/beta fold hydrolase [Nitratiruptor sp. YY09-18]|uniref:alpha/beta fold hydrolase n=1 Tax=Nitratiruptor sp. YY09-18 TaxID=2724901 RepID=UPI0019164B30|nr:alpha/beta hydrolase [Nitratiruptor sp. YY09-18]BCD68296.1 2-hydroxy-6-oxohepta-2,4-dienoate hydrolase [Nitratiruptor sp. YY09-18]